jgi:hypothetical protein
VNGKFLALVIASTIAANRQIPPEVVVPSSVDIRLRRDAFAATVATDATTPRRVAMRETRCVADIVLVAVRSHFLTKHIQRREARRDR